MSTTHELVVYDHPILKKLAESWTTFLVRGICAILFGIATMVVPKLTLLVLALLYGSYVLADGLLSLVGAFSGSKTAPRWWLVLYGLLCVLAGLVAILWPGITLLMLQLCIGVWSIAAGATQIIAAIRLRKEIDDEWLFIAGGVISVLFGAIMVMTPGIGMIPLVYAIATYALVYGIIQVAFAFHVRKWKAEV